MHRVGIALVAICGAVTLARGEQVMKEAQLLAMVDHLVFAGPDLRAATEKVEALLGVMATPGGQHPGRGTRNMLIAVGPAQYIEVIGPDPDQPAPKLPRPFGIDSLREPKLVTWSAKEGDLPRRAKSAAAHGVVLGALAEGSRQRPDGLLLKWTYTDPRTVVADGVVPFFINWGTTPHPAASASVGGTLIALRAEHPDPERVRRTLEQLEIALPVRPGSSVSLIATIDSPRGRVELR